MATLAISPASPLTILMGHIIDPAKINWVERLGRESNRPILTMSMVNNNSKDNNIDHQAHHQVNNSNNKAVHINHRVVSLDGSTARKVKHRESSSQDMLQS